ncbi:hypothetical protein TIFTF001_030366 [Ficus carica]|uniref:Uncharacterized protein n=1 Tax=Ficus carica TaxID=3494 RepID=A0AA88DTZ9_FICCA|nr:hypothetical protein TIFTF001_030366 [Ficus carica]
MKIKLQSDDDLNDEDIQRAYKEVYNKWIQVYKINNYLEDWVAELHKEKDVLKKAMINCEFLAAEKEMKLQEILLKLENTQKSFKMLNSGTA